MCWQYSFAGYISRNCIISQLSWFANAALSSAGGRSSIVNQYRLGDSSSQGKVRILMDARVAVLCQGTFLRLIVNQVRATARYWRVYFFTDTASVVWSRPVVFTWFSFHRLAVLFPGSTNKLYRSNVTRVVCTVRSTINYIESFIIDENRKKMNAIVIIALRETETVAAITQVASI